jgi:hypothetical protein
VFDGRAEVEQLGLAALGAQTLAEFARGLLVDPQ